MTQISNRGFGVEIECGIDPEVASDVLGQNGLRWDIDEDGTWSEIRTPVLRGREGLDTLKRAFDLLKGAGAYVTDSDGMHVHHDAPEFGGRRGYNKELLLRLVKSWGSCTDVIDNLVAPDRVGVWAAPKAWEAHKLADFENALLDFDDGYDYRLYAQRGDLNVNSLDYHGSLEIRQHQGTLDYEVAEAWILFGQRFIESVVGRRKIITCPSAVPANLLRNIGVSKKHAKVLLERRDDRDNTRSPDDAYYGNNNFAEDDESYWCDGCQAYH